MLYKSGLKYAFFLACDVICLLSLSLFAAFCITELYDMTVCLVMFLGDDEMLEGDGDITTESNSTMVRHLDEQLVGIIIGTTAVSILLMTAVVLLCIVRRRNRQKYAQCKSSRNSHHMALNLQTATMATNGRAPSVGKLSNGLLYNNVIVCDVGEEEEDEDVVVGGCPVPIITNGSDMYREPFDGIQMRKLPEPPVMMVDSTGTTLGYQYIIV